MNQRGIVILFGLALICASSYVLFFQEHAPFAAGAIAPAYLQYAFLFGALLGGIILISLVYAWMQKRNKRFQ